MKLDDGIASDARPGDLDRSTRHKWRRAAATAAGAAALTGAIVMAAAPSGDGGSTVLAQRDGPSAPASTVPQAPAAERLSDSSRLRLDGIGSIIVGMTLEEASAAAGMPVRIIPNSDLAGTGSCGYAQAEGGDPAGLSFMVIAGRIARIDVVGTSAIRTLSGVGIGSTDVEVQATYPGRIRVQPNPYSGHRGGRDLVYEADEASRHLGLLFQTDAGRVSSFRSGSHGAVMAPEGCA